jgi:hypothetical protein
VNARPWPRDNAASLFQDILARTGDFAEDRHGERARLLDRDGDPRDVDEFLEPGLDLFG